MRSRIFSQRGESVTRKLGEESVIVPVRGDIADLASVFVLNESASVLWSKLAQSATEESLVQALLDEYELSPEQARTDVTTFIATLSDVGLVQAVANESP
ncbi:MAG: PqqD family protein [Polyangiaceae bacterium]|nr:PqqD family protein [Polyangiaceae bacterium]